MQTRHDAYYYLPRFARLEAKVLARSQAKLRDFILAMSGGSTPKTDEQEKYYADGASGIPFVRVQNLSVSGELSLDDVKFVNRETHEGLLARSQVKPDDLLVKITGVGRMAVASVSASGFEGNINQHIARIRTKDRFTSEALATWLNTDIAEALAKRRSTGGTRPALDFGALRSMPVILDDRVQTAMRGAFDQYKRALAKAEEKLAGIDAYLLSELGITPPPVPENSIANRIFTAQRRELAGWRFDARVHRYSYDLLSQIYENVWLKNIAAINPPTVFSNINEETPLSFIPMESISEKDGSIVSRLSRPYIENIGYTRFQESDLLWAKITPCMENGKSAVAEGLLNGYGFGSTEFHVLRTRTENLNIKYLHALLRMKSLRQAATNFFGGSSGHQRVDTAFLLRLRIPLPNIEIQNQMVEKIEQIKIEAERLKFQAESNLEATKRRIESMLLGEAA